MSEAGDPPSGGSKLDVSAVVVCLNGLPWLGRCLESVAAYETVVVDHGSVDGSLELVRERFPDVHLIRQANLGMGAGNNAGMRAASGRYFLLLNSDARMADGAVDRLVELMERRPDVAVAGPRLRNPDGTLQPSVRGFPTPWRISTEYFFLRKLAPGSHALIALYGAGFDHRSTRDVDWVSGACLLVRRAAVEEVGYFDEDYFMFSEETDWCYRFHEAGWAVVFHPEAECVHVGGATHGGRLFRENVRGHLRFLAKHRGADEAERARKLMLAALRLRAVVYGGERGRQYRDAAGWLASASAEALLERTSIEREGARAHS